ncbi:MAG: homoserine kinase [Chloroflexota bacterium]
MLDRQENVTEPSHLAADSAVSRVTVRVPATVANMGPGFDCIGVALDIWNELTVERGAFSVSVSGDGEESLPRDERNLVVRGLRAAFASRQEKVPEVRYICRNDIPYSRGLGSSSAAIVAGLLAGFALLDHAPEPRDVLDLAADIEGHPDNVAPAILGGCQIGVHSGEHWITSRVPLPQKLKAVVMAPDVEGETAEARALLATEVSRADAVFNIGRAALLVNALCSGQLELLKDATEDRLHQPARSRVYRSLNTVIRAAMTGGAKGAFLAGAGPAVMALTAGREYTVAYEMTEAARLHGIDAKTRVVSPSDRGGHIVEME